MKRIICLLLCLIMIIPAAVSTAAANPGISSVSVSFTPPKAGTRASVRPSAQTPSGLNYTYNAGSSYWFDANTLQQLPSSAVLQAGKKYFARLCIEPKDSGDCFDDDVQVICTGSGITKVTVQRGRAQLFVHAYFTPQPVEKVALKKIQNVRLKSPKKGRIDVSWKQLTAKQRKKTSKIQIQYSQIKTFTKNVKTKWVSKAATKCTIKNLKRGKIYYVRIRAYRKNGNYCYVSRWVTKKIKTKKK